MYVCLVSWGSLWISAKTNQHQPTNSLSFFISVLKMSGSKLSIILFFLLSSPIVFCLSVGEHDNVERGNRCRRLPGKGKCSSLFRRDDKCIRGVSVCVCMFVCPLQRDYHMKTPCVKAGIPGRICHCSVKHAHKHTHSEAHTHTHKHTD